MNKLFVIAGTNASGKSGLGIELATKYGAEIISADSRQVFKGLDLGSGKVKPEETRGVPHHMLDVAELNELFTLADFQSGAYKAIDSTLECGNKAFLVGGTGLYVNSVVDGYNLCGKAPDLDLRAKVMAKSIDELIEIMKEHNPEKLATMDLHNKNRLERAVEKALSGDKEENPSNPKYETCVIGVTWPREILYERIRERLDRRLDQGMIAEVEGLRAKGATDDFLYRLGLEYRYILMYLRGEFSDFDAFYNKLFMEIRHLAKEQMTWFRKRTDMQWVDMTGNPVKEASEIIERFYD